MSVYYCHNIGSMLQEIKKQYKPFANFLCRTPLLSLQKLLTFSEENLKHLFQDTVINEAILKLRYIKQINKKNRLGLAEPKAGLS